MEDYALIVGVEHYPIGSFNALPGALNDADDFYEWITTGGNVKPSNCKLLKSDKALDSVLIGQIEDYISDCCTKAVEVSESGGRFYFFFSGHGLGVNGTEAALILSDWKEGLNRAFAADKWKESIKARGAFKEVLFFLDCCRSKKINFAPSSNGLYNPRVHDEVSSINTLIAHATSAFYKAHEGDIGKRRNGFFTSALLRGLNGEAVNGEGKITFESLKQFIEGTTASIARDHNKVQKAKVHYSHSAETLFIDVDSSKIKEIIQTIIIRFSADAKGPFVLEDGNLDEIGKYEAINNELKLELSRGLYIIYDANGKEINFGIKHNLNEIKYVQF